MFFKIGVLQNVIFSRPAFLLKRDSSTCVFLWILRNFLEHIFIGHFRWLVLFSGLEAFWFLPTKDLYKSYNKLIRDSLQVSYSLDLCPCLENSLRASFVWSIFVFIKLFGVNKFWNFSIFRILWNIRDEAVSRKLAVNYSCKKASS